MVRWTLTETRKGTNRGELRGILYVGDSKAGKVMRIHDQKYGRWVDIWLPHGTFIMFSTHAGGSSSPRYVHGVRNAEGTYTICFDFGQVFEKGQKVGDSVCKLNSI